MRAENVDESISDAHTAIINDVTERLTVASLSARKERRTTLSQRNC